MPETLSTRALCTLADVKEYLGIVTNETDTDNLLTRLVNSASDALYRTCNREFKVNGTNPQTRKFDFFENSYRLCFEDYFFVGDFASHSSVVIKSRLDASTVQTPVAADIDDLPRIREAWEPFTVIRLRNAPRSNLYYLEVTGNFGFPSVPEDIRQACIVTAGTWFARDVQKFSETFSLQEDRVELPRAIPSQVRETVRQYGTAVR